MTDLRISPAAGDAGLREWQHVHNVIIPTDVLSLDQVRERSGRHRLAVAHLGDTLIGCSTLRPPEAGSETATVIARVLPAHRRQGFGELIYAQCLEQARLLGARVIETVVLATNPDGLRFALSRGFAEVETYLLPGDTVPYTDLRLTQAE